MGIKILTLPLKLGLKRKGNLPISTPICEISFVQKEQ